MWTKDAFFGLQISFQVQNRTQCVILDETKCFERSLDATPSLFTAACRTGGPVPGAVRVRRPESGPAQARGPRGDPGDPVGLHPGGRRRQDVGSSPAGAVGSWTSDLFGKCPEDRTGRKKPRAVACEREGFDGFCMMGGMEGVGFDQGWTQGGGVKTMYHASVK